MVEISQFLRLTSKFLGVVRLLVNPIETLIYMYRSHYKGKQEILLHCVASLRSKRFHRFFFFCAVVACWPRAKVGTVYLYPFPHFWCGQKATTTPLPPEKGKNKIKHDDTRSGCSGIVQREENQNTRENRLLREDITQGLQTSPQHLTFQAQVILRRPTSPNHKKDKCKKKAF